MWTVIDFTGKRWTVTGSLKMARLLALGIRKSGIRCMVVAA